MRRRTTATPKSPTMKLIDDQVLNLQLKQARIQELESEIVKLSKEMQFSRKNIKKLARESQEKTQLIQMQQTQNSENKATIIILETETAALKAKNEAERVRFQELMSNHCLSHQDEVKSITAKLGKLKAQNKELGAQNTRQAAKIKRLTAQIKPLTAQIKPLTAQIKPLTAQPGNLPPGLFSIAADPADNSNDHTQTRHSRRKKYFHGKNNCHKPPSVFVSG